MFVRLKWFESILLVFAMVGLFRPDFLLDRVYPAFATVDMSRAAIGEFKISKDLTFRLHVVRETDYGDRFKLFLMKGAKKPGLIPYGIELGEVSSGRYPVINVAFNSPAAKAGIRPYEDFVTNIDIQQLGRPAKEWVYPLAFLALGLAMLSQLIRRRVNPISG